MMNVIDVLQSSHQMNEILNIKLAIGNVFGRNCVNISNTCEATCMPRGELVYKQDRGACRKF